MNLCTDCSEQFTDVSRHWALSDCTPPDLSDIEHEILTGLLMGDASISHRDRDRPAIRLRMGNEEYLQHLHAQFKPMTTGVEQASDTGGWETNITMYRLRWRGRAEFNEYASWYTNGEKVFPSNLSLTPTIMKHWFVCDGSLSDRGVMRLSMRNERTRKGQIEQMFEDAGFEVSKWDQHEHRCSAIFHAHVRDQLFVWMGDPPAGFSHKWP